MFNNAMGVPVANAFSAFSLDFKCRVLYYLKTSLPHKTVLCCTLSAPQDKHTLQGTEQDIIS